MVVENDGTKEKLFRAAVKVFARKGYKGATVREICAAAGAGNLSSINYYFGSKEELYRKILDLIFSEYQKQRGTQAEAGDTTTPPEDQLRHFIDAYCRMLYRGVEVDADMRSIFMAEMSRPSPWLDQMTEKYMMPQAFELMNILSGILGPKTPPQVLLDCGVSIVGAIGYYSVAWPLFTRMFPDLPDMQLYADKLADHVYHFSLGGLQAVKKSLRSGRRASADRGTALTAGKRTAKKR
jgi:TetR/AcrR family transcriptional regulator, regulator of cefoperazone and chloramphenicol sensitivity